jgi:hypothetical protein
MCPLPLPLSSPALQPASQPPHLAYRYGRIRGKEISGKEATAEADNGTETEAYRSDGESDPMTKSLI